MTDTQAINDELSGKAQETRRRILSSALSLFQNKGFDQTTMRDIAKEARMAVGAAYYYFKTKDEMVMAFYRETQAAAYRECERICADNKDFKDRVREIMLAKFEQFAPYHGFFSILFRNAANPESPISPFSPQTRVIREQAIGLFRMAMQDTHVKVAEEFKPYLPTLLWLMQMGLILFWIHDKSPQQQYTIKLTGNALELVFQLMRASRFPLIGRIKHSIITLLEDAGLSATQKGVINEVI